MKNTKGRLKLNQTNTKPLTFNNWGNSLGNLAKTKEGTEAEELYHQVFEKFQRAIEIKPDNHEAFYNWGTSLGNLAKTKEGTEAEELYHQAFEKFQRAIEFGGHCYNLACAYSLKLDKENALYYLDKSLRKNEISIKFVKEDEDWQNYLENKEFKNLLKKYEK